MKRIGIIFNPVARGEKAKHFRHQLEQLKSSCSLKPTAGPGHAKELAIELVNNHFDVVVAAGGDGTINEVVNGIAKCSEGFQKVTLGVIPFGTANVFAVEHDIPANFSKAWNVINGQNKISVDLPVAIFKKEGAQQLFIQMAGAGFDAMAVKAVHWNLKKKIGHLAYAWAAFTTLFRYKPPIRIVDKPEWGGQEWIIISNGRFYAGKYPFFPDARKEDGLLDVCAFPKVNLYILALSFLSLCFFNRLPIRFVNRYQSAQIELTSPNAIPLELDGEDIRNGHGPLTFQLFPEKLTLLVP